MSEATTDEREPTREEWQALYEAAARFKEAAPWDWMYEADIIGVQNPETGDLGFASIMGNLGEHYALSLYLGPASLYGFMALEEAGPLAAPETLLELPQLMASWEDRNDLHAQDRKRIKELGLKFRGRQAWPMFRSYRPGYTPWFVTGAEARFLTVALEQALDVALRGREDESLLEVQEDESFLIRAPDDEGEWQDTWQSVAPPEPRMVEYYYPDEAVETLQRQPQRAATLEMDLVMIPSGFRDRRDERPRYGYVLLNVDSGSGMVLGVETLQADPTLDDMWAEIPLIIAGQLARQQLRPRTISVSNPRLAGYLQPVLDALDIELDFTDYLPTLEAVKGEMWNFLMR